MEIKENAHILMNCFLSIRELTFWQNFTKNHQIYITYDSLERQPVILTLMAPAAFGKQKSKQNIILSNFTFFDLYTDLENSPKKARALIG